MQDNYYSKQTLYYSNQENYYFNQEQKQEQITPQQLQSILEWAGVRLLSLSLSGFKPKPCKSNWPNLPPNQNHTFSKTKLKSLTPTSNEIDLLDKIFNLILLIPQNQIQTRRILQSRSLLNPLTLKPIYPWTEIALLLSLNRKTIRRYHHLGLRQIISNSQPNLILQLREKTNF